MDCLDAWQKMLDWWCANMGLPPGLVRVEWKEPQMQSYAYEVVVSEKWETKDGVKAVKVREAQIIDKAEGLLEKPNRFKLLMKNAAKITELGCEESEVSVNIRPFCA